MKIIKARVKKGEGIGQKKIGFPTANLDLNPEETWLKDGVYAAYAVLNTKKYKAALVISRGSGKVEAHLIGYVDEDFYGEELEVRPVKFVSRLERFLSSKQLSKKIVQDVELVKKVLRSVDYVSRDACLPVRRSRRDSV